MCSPDILKYIKLPVCITILDPKAIEDVREMLKNQYKYNLENEVDYLILKISAYVDYMRVRHCQLVMPQGWRKIRSEWIYF